MACSRPSVPGGALPAPGRGLHKLVIGRVKALGYSGFQHTNLGLKLPVWIMATWPRLPHSNGRPTEQLMFWRSKLLTCTGLRRNSGLGLNRRADAPSFIVVDSALSRGRRNHTRWRLLAKKASLRRLPSAIPLESHLERAAAAPQTSHYRVSQRCYSSACATSSSCTSR